MRLRATDWFTTASWITSYFLLIFLLSSILGVTEAVLKENFLGDHRQLDVKRSDEFRSSTPPSGSDANGTRNFQVFRVLPRNVEELAVLNALYRLSSEYELDFWKAPTAVGVYSDVMVGPDFLNTVLDFIGEHNLEYTVIIDDVQRLIMQREKSDTSSKISFHDFRPVNGTSTTFLTSLFSKRMKDDSSIPATRNRAKYGFGDYHSYDEMLKWLGEIELFYPHMARVFTIGRTHEGRPIRGIKIGNPVGDNTKRAVWIDGGMHAREWAAIHTALYFIEQLIAQYGVDSKVTSYVNNLNFYIVPVANPDGFEYSRSDITPQTRFWRKNRGQQVCKKDRWRRERCCGGVDLNRNFDFHWGEIGSSEDLCSDIFQGKAAFSEPESRAIRDKILSAELNGRVDAFITLHTYSQMWIHPYNHERKSFPDDIQDLQSIGKQGVDAIEGVYGTKFRFGTGADILYPSAGGSDDWAKAHARIKYVYLLELRPGEEEWDGFLLDRRQLIPTGRETWEGVKVVIDAVLRKAQQQSNGQRPLSVSLPPATPAQTSDVFRQSGVFPHNSPKPPPTVVTTPPPTIQTTTPTAIATFRRLTALAATVAPSSQPPPLLPTSHRFFVTANNNNRIGVERRTGPVLTMPSAGTPGTAGRSGSNVMSTLQTNLQQRLALLRERQLQTRREYEARAHQAEQQQELLFWQNHQNLLHSGCFDRSRWCGDWIKRSPQICRTSGLYMQHECRSACRFCVP